MNMISCPYEDELLDALGRGFIGREITAHALECVPCSELRMVAGALLDERADAIVEAPVPAAGTMWWRLQIRQRQDAQATARRSLLIGQAVTLSVGMVMVIFLLGSHLTVGAREALASVRLGTPVLLALASWIVLAPIAGYVAIRQK
ncbi:MAG TPA: hypothetical protein VNM92_06325 [Thermoanaerobaculia bacterium]|nr:hypothetical protein [Thermoanaerobaculia bacterium]